MLILLSFVLTAGADAQFDSADTETITPEEVYFVIDASGSMASKLDLAEQNIQREVDALQTASPDILVSRTYFGGSNGGVCGTDVKIQPVLTFRESESTNLSAEGSTQLGTALDAVLREVGSKASKVYLVTDASQTDGCGVDVCEVAKKLLPQSNVELKVIPIRPDPEDIDSLGCLQGYQQMSTDPPAIIPTDTDDIGTPSFIATGLIMFGALLLCIWIILRLLIALQKNEAIASKERIPTQTTKITFAWVLLLTGSAILICTPLLLLGRLHQEIPAVHTFINERFTSTFISSALLGFVGWSLIQVWSINEFRQNAANRKHLQTLKEEAKAEREKSRNEQFERDQKPKLERTRKLNIGRARIYDRYIPSRYSGELDREALKELQQKVRAVEDSIEQKVQSFAEAATIKDSKALSELSKFSRYDYIPIVDYLYDAGEIDEVEALKFGEFFGAWSSVRTKQSGDISTELELISNFEIP